MATVGIKVAGSPRSRKMGPARRKKVKNNTDPRGQFARYLRAWYDARKEAEPAFTQAKLAEAMGLSERALRFWLKGVNGPTFEDLDLIADVLGHSDWADLAIAIRQFCQTGSLK